MATNTYVALKATTLNSNSASVTFDNIPQGYTDLVLVIQAKNLTGNSDVQMRFNSDSGSNYSATILGGDGSSAYSARRTNSTSVICNYFDFLNSTTATQYNINIQNYSNATTYKSVLVRANRADQATEAIVGIWRATPAAITQIDLTPSSSSFATGSTFTLYGISDAGDTGAKAIGGDVYTDSTYVYHAFTMSGKFTPTQSLTADILVVAGGGGGGNFGGGGGGAGGLLAHTSQSLTTTNYAVIVGGGGPGAAANSALYGTAGANSQFGALTASVGGGRGGGRATSSPGTTGGSGGGNAYSLGSLAGTSGQGYAGGAGTANGGGGGGGAGEAGNTDAVQGSGGDGTSTYSSWAIATETGENVGGTYYYAGGGGGFGDNGVGGIGGDGGGGTGASSTSVRRDGLAYTGGGGGATSQTVTAGNGGSGLVIVRYAK